MVFGADWDEPLTPEELAGTHAYTNAELGTATTMQPITADSLVKAMADFEAKFPRPPACGASEDHPHFTAPDAVPGQTTSCLACGKRIVPLPSMERAVEIPTGIAPLMAPKPFLALRDPMLYRVPGEYRYSSLDRRLPPTYYIGWDLAADSPPLEAPQAKGRRMTTAPESTTTLLLASVAGRRKDAIHYEPGVLLVVPWLPGEPRKMPEADSAIGMPVYRIQRKGDPKTIAWAFVTSKEALTAFLGAAGSAWEMPDLPPGVDPADVPVSPS